MLKSFFLMLTIGGLSASVVFAANSMDPMGGSIGMYHPEVNLPIDNSLMSEEQEMRIEGQDNMGNVGDSTSNHLMSKDNLSDSLDDESIPRDTGVMDKSEMMQPEMMDKSEMMQSEMMDKSEMMQPEMMDKSEMMQPEQDKNNMQMNRSPESINK